MSDIVFNIQARKQVDGKWSVSLMTPSIIRSQLAFANNREWQAFRSLLIPSTKADFTLEEFDEKGNKL